MTATLAPAAHQPAHPRPAPAARHGVPGPSAKRDAPEPAARPPRRRGIPAMSLAGKLFGMVAVLVAMIFATNAFSITSMRGMADSSEELAALNELSELRGEIATGAKQAQLLFQEMLSAQDQSSVAALIEEQDANDVAMAELMDTYAAGPAGASVHWAEFAQSYEEAKRLRDEDLIPAALSGDRGAIDPAAVVQIETAIADYETALEQNQAEMSAHVTASTDDLQAEVGTRIFMVSVLG